MPRLIVFLIIKWWLNYRILPKMNNGFHAFTVSRGDRLFCLVYRVRKFSVNGKFPQVFELIAQTFVETVTEKFLTRELSRKAWVLHCGLFLQRLLLFNKMKTTQWYLTLSCSKRTDGFGFQLHQFGNNLNLCGWNITSKNIKNVVFFSYFDVWNFILLYKMIQLLGTKNHVAAHFCFSIRCLKEQTIFDCCLLNLIRGIVVSPYSK